MKNPDESSKDQSNGDAPRRRALELCDVTFGHRPETSLCLRRASFIVHRGDLVMIRTNAAQKTRRFAAMLQGLIRPAGGNVLFSGRDWAKQHVRTQFNMRSRIGRVFDGQGWVANLNVRENLVLSKLHHGADMAEIEEQLVFWADWFQLGKVTRKRPAFVEASQLQIHQWIRAYLGRPSLLILERPMRTVSSQMFATFLASIRYMRSRGAAVIWIAGSTLGDALDTVRPELFLDLRPGLADTQWPLPYVRKSGGRRKK